MPKRSHERLYASILPKVFPNVETRLAKKRMAEGPPVYNLSRMRTVFSLLRTQLGSDIELRIQTELITGEQAAHDAGLFGYNDAVDFERLLEWPIKRLASLVPAEKSQRVLNKWLGSDAQSQATGLEVIEQSGDLYSVRFYTLKLEELPDCLRRLAYMKEGDFSCGITVDDAKQLCVRFQPAKIKVDGQIHNFSSEQLKEYALRLCQVFADDGNHDDMFFDC